MFVPGAVDMSDLSSSIKAGYLKLAIVGEPKSGKSWLAATAPKPVLMWDFDGRAASLNGRKDVHIKTLMDAGPGDPRAFSTLSADVGMLEYNKSKGDPIPMTFILDSMTNLAKYVIYQAMKDDPSQMKEITVGGIKIKIPRGYNAYQNEDQALTNILVRLFALGNVIAIFHERPEEAADSTDENPKFTGKVSVHPPRYRNFLPLFNEQWRMVSKPNKVYEVQVASDYKFTASTTFANLSANEEPDIIKLMAKSAAAKVPIGK